MIAEIKQNKTASFDPVCEIKTMKIPMPDDIIIVNFYSDKIAVDEASKIMQQLGINFPFNQIIGKFDCYDLSKTPCLEVLG
jgi:hypothetical protein